jgi:hypothetical protein
VATEFGIARSAETYEVVSKKHRLQKPSRDYLGKLVAAAEKFSFPSEYQAFLKSIPLKSKGSGGRGKNIN